MAKTNERPKPLIITDADTSEVYTLDFDRDAVRFAEQRGFRVMSVSETPETSVADLFFYAFRKNHKGVARANADKILDALGGLLPEEVARLQELYASSINSLNVDGERKNSRLTVEL